ncbi:unnamed protein product [Nippostrongylus brasiliensis]|uniref:phospholipase D n=1 Tax=Nippostrongylus brasiliensis TaxID=27835 RepID=A0A0N4YWR6_NIPBR|nr:unnamed protein product [Nippostrongylus brasiliensis]
MKRPALEGHYWRLDEILKRKASQGVHIFILMYKEMEMALGLNSMYSKRTLQNLHPNIKVMRHPDHYPSTGTFFWAHHEKLVVIDQLIAFVGGVDLCFGRWDDHHHLLTDLGSVQFGQQHLVLHDINMSSGLRSLVSAPLTLSPLGLEEQEEVDSSDKTKSPESSKKATGENKEFRHVTTIVVGNAMEDDNTSGIEHAAGDGEVVYADVDTGGVMLRVSRTGEASFANPSNEKKGKSFFQSCWQLEKQPGTEEVETEDKDSIDGGVKLWVGKDYVNYIHKDFVEVDLPFHDFIDRGSTPRMPWHDIHSVTFGAPARDVARHFIQRWNATKTEKLKDDESYPYLLPKSYENLRVPRVFKNPAFSYNVDVQMAYLSLIANSKHYLYIENQFFVSMIDSNDVLNEICKVICNRIIRAHKEKEPFRVYIMIPLMPGFEGNVGAPGGSSLQAVLHWTYVSLSRGPNSLFERLKAVR